MKATNNPISIELLFLYNKTKKKEINPIKSHQIIRLKKSILKTIKNIEKTKK